jgi:hypothetical protein
LQNANFRFQISDFRFQISDFRFQISDTQGQRPFQVAAITFADNRRWVATSNQSHEMGA